MKSLRTPDEKMWTPDFFSYCQTLYLGYEIDDVDDIAKIIERKRGMRLGGLFWVEGLREMIPLNKKAFA